MKPDACSGRQLCGAGALGGIGFTMSLFIAGEAFPDPAEYAVAKIAIFLASLIAAGLGTLILWPRAAANDDGEAAGRSGERLRLVHSYPAPDRQLISRPPPTRFPIRYQSSVRQQQIVLKLQTTMQVNG